MAEKALLQIKEAEAQAQACIKHAQEEAAQIIKRAEKAAADAFLQFSDVQKQKLLENKMQAETTARKNSMEFSNETADLCLELNQKLLSNKSKAVDAVIQMIIT